MHRPSHSFEPYSLQAQEYSAHTHTLDFLTSTHTLILLRGAGSGRIRSVVWPLMRSETSAQFNIVPRLFGFHWLCHPQDSSSCAIIAVGGKACVCSQLYHRSRRLCCSSRMVNRSPTMYIRKSSRIKCKKRAMREQVPSRART